MHEHYARMFHTLQVPHPNPILGISRENIDTILGSQLLQKVLRKLGVRIGESIFIRKTDLKNFML